MKRKPTARELRKQKRIAQLYKRPKSELATIVKRSHKVIDLKGVSKGVLISYIIEDEF